ncbi:MAG: DUF1911 domain-containing protein [Lachnospiraceae bacterium]|nr:DUF1911 domain-containing protein [Lachnospiraceae bacterium]
MGLRRKKCEGYKVRGKGWTEQELKDAISNVLTGIEKFEKTIEELKEDEGNGIQRYPIDNVLAIKNFHVLCCQNREALMDVMYFAGEDIDRLIPHFNAAVADLNIAFPLSEDSPGYIGANYGAVLQIIAFGILLEADEDTMRKIAHYTYNYMCKEDALIDFLLSACDIGWTHQTGIYFDTNYRDIGNMIVTAQTDKAEAADLLEIYMKKVNKKKSINDEWRYETGAVAKILGLDDSRLKKNKNYPYDLVHYRDTRKFSSDTYSAWLEMMNMRKQGQEQLTKEKEYIKELELDYHALDNKAFYEKYKERFLDELFRDEKEYQNFQAKEKEGILGFLLVNLLVTDGYILQLDFKDEPEEYLADFVNERLEIDYNGEAIEDIESNDSFENMDAEMELYDTKYVKKMQRKLNRKGFQLVWFQLDNDQYYVCILPKAEILPKKWHEIKLITL